MTILLSVTLSNYNHSAYLPDRLQALLSQLPPNAEFVIVDDASTDSSMDILSGFASKDPRIRLYRNEQNLGSEATINRSIELSRGAYVSPYAVDDIILPGCIPKMLKALLAHPKIPFCSSEFASLETRGRDFGSLFIDHPLEKRAPYVVLTADEVGELYKKRPFSCGSSVMLKREIWTKYGGYQRELGSDWFFNRIVPICEGMIFFPQVLHIWRCTPSSHGKNFWGKESKRKMLFALLGHLARPENRELRRRMRKYKVMLPRCKEFTSQLLCHPKYYDFLLQVLFRKVL